MSMTQEDRINQDAGVKMTSTAIDHAAGGPTEAIAAQGAGLQIWVYGWALTANVAGSMKLLSAATAKTGTMPIAETGGSAPSGKHPIFKCGTNEALNITTVTCTLDGVITWAPVRVTNG